MTILTSHRSAVLTSLLPCFLRACHRREYTRMSQLYIPMVTSDVSAANAASDSAKSVSFLHRAGFIRQVSPSSWILVQRSCLNMPVLQQTVIRWHLHLTAAGSAGGGKD